MGAIATIYGCILHRCGRDSGAANLANEKAVLSLPEQDSHPHLTRNMFSITASEYPSPGYYKIQTVHFGLSLKEDGQDWDVWLKKFERLLARMCWTDARLHLDLETAGEFGFKWANTADVNEPANPTQWAFSGGPRQFGHRRQRFQEWVPVAEEELVSRPEDTSLMTRLIYAYQRIDQDEKAQNLFRQLQAADPDRAKFVEWI